MVIPQNTIIFPQGLRLCLHYSTCGFTFYSEDVKLIIMVHFYSLWYFLILTVFLIVLLHYLFDCRFVCGTYCSYDYLTISWLRLVYKVSFT